jgi:TPR repeat protein
VTYKEFFMPLFRSENFGDYENAFLGQKYQKAFEILKRLTLSHDVKATEELLAFYNGKSNQFESDKIWEFRDEKLHDELVSSCFNERWRFISSKIVAYHIWHMGRLLVFREDKHSEYRKGIEMMIFSADHGCVEAQYEYGEMLLSFPNPDLTFDGDISRESIAANRGRGDVKKAIEYFRLAANNNDYGWAKFELGKLYTEGMGVIRDYSIAYMWTNLAKKEQRTENNRISDHLEILSRIMSSEQISEAQRFSREWKSQ